MGEVSGSLGDLGTFLPHIVGAITVVGMDPTSVLTTFGLFYTVSGAFYGVPMAVQPMKAASAAVLIEPIDPAAIGAARSSLADRRLQPRHVSRRLRRSPAWGAGSPS
jgi:Molybdate transporter of MFS superfamily